MLIDFQFNAKGNHRADFSETRLMIAISRKGPIIPITLNSRLIMAINFYRLTIEKIFR